MMATFTGEGGLLGEKVDGRVTVNQMEGAEDGVNSVEGDSTTGAGGGATSSPIAIKGKGAAAGGMPKRSPMIGDKEEAELRKWCTGQPPKESFLGSPSGSTPRVHLTRRSTIADKPELDHQVAGILQTYKGEDCLLFSAEIVRILSPFWKGAKPIADRTIFERILFNKDINRVHADHAIAALKVIGIHCKHLTIVAPIYTSEYGDVFNREIGDINTGNDWDKIFEYLPNLESVTFKHPDNEPTVLQRTTYFHVERAIRLTRLENLKIVNFTVPPQVLAGARARAIHSAQLAVASTTLEDSPTEEQSTMN